MLDAPEDFVGTVEGSPVNASTDAGHPDRDLARTSPICLRVSGNQSGSRILPKSAGMTLASRVTQSYPIGSGEASLLAWSIAGFGPDSVNLESQSRAIENDPVAIHDVAVSMRREVR